MKEALLVVDVDSLNHWDDEDWLKRNGRLAGVPVIKGIVDAEREQGGIVLFVVLDYKRPEYAWHQFAQDVQGCIGCDEQFASRLAPFLEHRHGERFEPVFAKKTNNAFMNTALTEFLLERNIEKIKLIGCNLFQCLKDTAIGAVANGFHVTLLAKGAFPPFANEDGKAWWRDNIIFYNSSEGTHMSVTVEE